MEKVLEAWRQDAVSKHQYGSAIFVGDKLLALTNNPTDALWLAQIHFTTGNYTRAQSVIAAHGLLELSPQCRYLSAHCYIKQEKYDEALEVLGQSNPVHLISAPQSKTARRKLAHVSANKSRNAVNGTLRTDRAGSVDDLARADAKAIKAEAAMCYLRGLCFMKKMSFDLAKECYKTAVKIDVQCFEAYDQLMTNALMSPREERDFLNELDFDNISAADTNTAQEAGQMIKLLYTTRLSKYKHHEAFEHAVETLSTHYGLSRNHDLMLEQATALFTQCRFQDALAITTEILTEDQWNFAAYPLHLAILYELEDTNALFLTSHKLADEHPEEAATWLAIGIYYMAIDRIAEARRFFSKSSAMNPHSGPAWIGFAHTFAIEGEHDQAIAAYATASRLFQGLHLPQMFLGMQNLCLNNMTIAREYLNEAYEICDTDPLLLNEMGVVFYHSNAFEEAVAAFQRSIQLSVAIEAERKQLVPVRNNLGQAWRRLRKFDKALDCFEQVLREGGKDCPTLTAKGIVLLELNRPFDAVVAFHEALAIAPQDPIATDFLNRAFEELDDIEDRHGLFTIPRLRVNEIAALDEAAEAMLDNKRHEAREMMDRKLQAAQSQKLSPSRQRHSEMEDMEDDDEDEQHEVSGHDMAMGDDSMMQLSDDDDL